MILSSNPSVRDDRITASATKLKKQLQKKIFNNLISIIVPTLTEYFCSGRFFLGQESTFKVTILPKFSQLP